MKKILFILFFISSFAHAQILTHYKEIGAYSLNKNTSFIFDSEIYSPKSAAFYQDNLVINSLEGGKTLIYDTLSWKKIKTISHSFPNLNSLAAIPGLKYAPPASPSSGKPVELAVTDNFIFVPYYRWSGDSNSTAASAIAMINKSDFSITQLIPTAPIPKTVKVNRAETIIASINWGDNTVGIYRLSKGKIISYKNIVIDKILYLDKNTPSDRDKFCGLCLRGAVITSDDKYLLVGKMGGGGIAIIDLASSIYLGTIPTPVVPRHLILDQNDQNLYLSSSHNFSVAKIPMSKIIQAIEGLKNSVSTAIPHSFWQITNLPGLVRTIALSHDEKYLFAAVYGNKSLSIIDNKTMRFLESHPVAPFPVGLAVNEKYLAITSQGRSGTGGNHVDIFKINY